MKHTLDDLYQEKFMEKDDSKEEERVDMTIGKVFHFDAAHYLPWHKGPCDRLHGHTWEVIIEVTGSLSVEYDIVIDYADLKAIVTPLLEQLDHRNLNELMPNPTCENLVDWFLLKLSVPLLEYFNLTRVRVKIQEGKGGYACKESILRGES